MMNDANNTPIQPGAKFTESSVEADGFDIRYFDAGSGDVVVYIHGGGGPRLSGTHDLLAETHRVIAFEVPGFGQSPVNDRSGSMEELARTILKAVKALGIDKFSVMGSSFGGKFALTMGLEGGDEIECLILVAPAAIRTIETHPPFDDPQALRALMFAHPERQPAPPPFDPEVGKKHLEIVDRLLGPPRDAEFEARLADLNKPVLALFGTADRIIPPDLAHFYDELLPACHLIMIYDAAHAPDADRPEAVASVASDFLNRREKFLVNDDSSLIHP